jgi:hypothetical protein
MDTISGYAQTFMNTQWEYFWKYDSTKTWVDTSGSTIYIGPTYFLGYSGAAFAFIISLIGAYEVAGQTMASIEESIDTWLGGYADGDYYEILKDADKSDAMQQFLVGFTWDMIVYALASMWHAIFTMTVGYLTCFFIFYRMKTVLSSSEANQGADARMIYGFKMALFGVLIGTVDYMGANAIKGNMASVLMSMGFLNHTSVDTDSEDVTLTTSDGSTTTVTTIGADTVDATLDYEKLMYMQDKWFNFFAI